MLWNRARPQDHKGQQVEVNSAEGVPNSERTFSPAEPGITATKLLNQAAELIQGIESNAAETLTRAHDLARRAAEQHSLTESRIRDWKSVQSAMEHSLNEANARAHKAEQLVRQTETEFAAMEERLSAADQRASYVDARAIEVEQMLTRLENLVQTQLFAERQPTMSRRALAA